MTVIQLTGASWTRKHDLPGLPLFPFVKIYYPKIPQRSHGDLQVTSVGRALESARESLGLPVLICTNLDPNVNPFASHWYTLHRVS
jgi:hypothetical protein